MTLVKRTIDADTARRMIDAAVARSREVEKAACIAIVNEFGLLKAFHSMDGEPHLAIDIAQNKAWSASSFGLPTHVLWDFIKNDPPLLHSITHTPRLTTYGGGYPIMLDGEMVGGIGISGGHYADDMDIARAALDAVGAVIS